MDRELITQLEKLHNPTLVVVVSLLTSVALVALAAPVYMDVVAASTTNSDLACLNKSEDEISSELGMISSETVNALPPEAQSVVAGGSIVVTVGESTHFSAEVNDQAQVQDYQTGEIDEPALRAHTDCETVDGIVESQNPNSELRQSLSRDEIDWEGASAGADAAANYGSSGAQSYEIVSKGESGDAGDAADGFSNGLTFD